ncbi:hypothetical protein [Tichowtungia aerotolerans]|uniref:Uncharacterized protein n=1 Tax=Tichowtungia aerotolerans TaxID=2697043 RepID=A0A6P1M6A0_9BACT|nr:hypothetical protein [Tichowtungia aerotolerans]QHI69371.1 hypothetical protein GT409_07865 [Tichowtungia aerotolerans]
MKSITYLITGTPPRLNDCLDLAAKSSAAPTVSLSLKYLESCRETDILTQLAGGAIAGPSATMKCTSKSFTPASLC